MTGTYSERNGVNSLRECALDSSIPTLAEVLNNHGWETCAMVTGPLVTETGLDRGFDDYRYREPEEELIGDWFDTAVETIDELADPFFAYVHLWEIHEPIDIPHESDMKYYGETPYGRMLSALDRAIEQLVQELPEETAIILHGDHGESITWRNSTVQGIFRGQRERLRYERGIDTRTWERLCNQVFDRFGPDINDHFIESGHGSTIYDYMINVPLVLAGPDFDRAIVDKQCRQIDVFPTVIDYLSIDTSLAVDGESLLPPKSVRDRVAYMRACGEVLQGKTNWCRGVRWDGKKYIEYPNQEWSAEVYDLESDRKELHCLDDYKNREQLRSHLPDAGLKNKEQQDVDERLKGLGYL